MLSNPNFYLKLCQLEEIGNRSPLDFDNPTLLASDNCYVLTGLKLHEFNNLCSKVPSTSLKSSENRLARSAIACLLMKSKLGVSHQVLATLFSFPDKRYVSRIIHSARKAFIDHFVPHHLGFNHISRQDVIDLHTRPLATRLLEDQLAGVILILDRTYIYFQKSANNLLQ